MTKLLEHAVETVRSLPAEVQDDLARTLLQLAGADQPVIRLTAEERADLAEADAEIAPGGVGDGCRNKGSLGQASFVKLRFTKRAVRQIEEIIDAIAEESPQGANRVLERMQSITTLGSPLPAGERSTRIVRCAAGEGTLRESECVERPLTRSLR
jgi:hypothetical protein